MKRLRTLRDRINYLLFGGLTVYLNDEKPIGLGPRDKILVSDDSGPNAMRIERLDGSLYLRVRMSDE